MENLSGVFCAFWTATGRNGEIPWPALEDHLRFILRSGVQGIMALGSTGEFLHFPPARREEILARIAAICREQGGAPIIANVSDVNHRVAVELARHARSLGASVVAVLPPWFFPMDQNDLAEFFIQIGRESGAPLGLYNFPEVTGKKIELETIERVARATRVSLVKQSGADFNYHHDLLRLGRQLGFAVMTGADTRLEEALALGCSGTVSGLANALPEALARIYGNFRRGVPSPRETAFVARAASCIAPLAFPLNVKAAVEARGFESGAPKNPLSSATQEVYRRVVSELSELYHANPEGVS